MFQFSTIVRDRQLDAIEAAIGPSPVLRVMTGVQPVDCAAAETGTRLVSITLPSDWMKPADVGTKLMNDTWQNIGITTAGFAGYYRIYAAGGAVCHAQGPMAQAWFPSSNFFTGQRVTYGASIYLCATGGTTSSTAGPSGTGTGIANGTAVFDYVTDTRGMMLADDTNFKVGQPFTVLAYAWTAGNP